MENPTMRLDLAKMAQEFGMSEERLCTELSIMPPVHPEAFASLKERALAAAPHSYERRYLFGLLAKYFLEEVGEEKGGAEAAGSDLRSPAKQRAA